MNVPLPVEWYAPGGAGTAQEGFHGAWTIGRITGADRHAARLLIRAAVRETLAAGSGVDASRVRVLGSMGGPPHALIQCEGGGKRVWLSIGHDAGLSLAALRVEGPVGVDLMRIVALPDCEAVAFDYLGPAVAAELADAPPACRPAAFARAWSAHEARLKCLGLGLVEWTPTLARRLEACVCRPLLLPEGFVGHLAVPCA